MKMCDALALKGRNMARSKPTLECYGAVKRQVGPLKEETRPKVRDGSLNREQKLSISEQ
jgi:hypothetical protein